MNRILWIVALLAFAGAGLLWWSGDDGRSPQHPAQPAGAGATAMPGAPSAARPAGAGDAPTGGVAASAGPSAPSAPLAAAQAAPGAPAAQTAPPLPATLKPPAPGLGFDAAAGRPSAQRIAVQAAGPAVAIPAFPEAGGAEMLVRGTVGGVDAQRWVRARFRCAGPAAIELSEIDDGAERRAPALRVEIEGGIFRCTTPGADAALANAAVEIARTVALMRAGFAGGRLEPGGEATIGGEAFRVVRCTPSHALLAAAADAEGQSAIGAEYPLAAGHWNEIAIWLAPDGAWLAAERLTGSPSTPAEPGFLVRRFLLRAP